LRNGRKILIRDVSLFAWVDPNEPGARAIPEYPIEVPNEGRIVGEMKGSEASQEKIMHAIVGTEARATS
jgi:hypothetical protein